jgi:hypothetical protein
MNYVIIICFIKIIDVIIIINYYIINWMVVSDLAMIIDSIDGVDYLTSQKIIKFIFTSIHSRVLVSININNHLSSLGNSSMNDPRQEDFYH